MRIPKHIPASDSDSLAPERRAVDASDGVAPGLRAFAAFLVALACACNEPAVEQLEPTRSYPSAEPVCAGGPSAPSATVYANIQTVGAAANAIEVADDYVWVVESNANTVSRYDLHAQRFDAYFIDVENERNPWDVYVEEATDEVFVTNWLADTLTVARADTGEVLDEIGRDAQAFDNPQGVAASAERLYVTNVAYRGPGDYAAGFVTVIDRRTREVLGRIETAHPNPSYVRRVHTPEGPAILVVNAGVIDSTNDGAFARGEASLELWRETDQPDEPAREHFVLPASSDGRVGAPGRPVVTPDRRYVYLPSLTAPTLFKFDLHQRRFVRGTDNPITMYETGGDATHSAAMDERGILYLTAFNDDAMYLLDTRCDELLAGPIALGTTDTYLEGPQSVRVVETNEGPRAYFIMTLSNALGRVDLGWDAGF